VITQNTTEYIFVLLPAQNVAAVQLNVFLTGISWLLITSKGQLASPLPRLTANSTVTVIYQTT
jgi:hypothetical protein